MTNPLRGLTIGARLLLIVLVMMLFTLTISFLISSRFETSLLEEIQGQTESLSKALQISVQQLTSKGMSDEKLLNDYVERLSSKGVKEISILSNEKQVVASSNPSKVGRTFVPRPGRRADNVLITGTLADDDMDFEGKKTYTLDVPIIVDNEKRGYVRLHLLLDDFQQIIHQALTRRLLATALIFLIGLAGVVALSFGVTRSLDQLAKAAGRVADGDLPGRIPSRRRDEVGRLVTTFNTMVERLGEQRALEGRLRRAERVSAIANLASAVAHEIRNPLNLISLSVDHLGVEFQPSDTGRAQEYARIIASVRDELRRLNRMVGDFLSYGRPPRLALRPCRAEETLDEVVSLVQAKSRDQRIEIVRRIPGDLPVINADPDGLRTCFLNIVLNALQATPPGGSLTIEATETVAGNGAAKGVVVSFSDTGCGILPSDLDRIFDPYFSTREAGVGLGLAITQRIVQDHGGDIRVDSVPDHGTTFRIELPAAGGPEAAASRDAA